MNLNFNPFDKVDNEVVKDIKFFFNQVNNNTLYKNGLLDSYDDHGIPALHTDVEYFHPNISSDDRMVYIAENIVYSGISQNNIICNTIISHFYGGRGIHQVATREEDPKKALVDFERMLKDEDYKHKILKNLEDARSFDIPIYGSTELRTSLFGSANSYVAQKDNKERDSHPGNIMQWVASFIEIGLTEKMANSQSLAEIFKHITTLPGVGSYYGYHCGTSNSVNPNININHDEDFCIPGPGARKTLDLLFPNISPKEFDYGDRVIWFRKNQVELLGDINIHESMHNIIVDGKKVFKDEQNELKTYGTEVLTCQAGVYHRLKNEPKLASRRKVARVDESLFERFLNNEKIIPSTAKTIKPKKEVKPKKEEKMELEEKNVNFNKLPENYKDPFPNIKLKDPSSFKRKPKSIDVVEELEKTLTGELSKIGAVVSRDELNKKISEASNKVTGENRTGKADKIINSDTYGTFKGEFKTSTEKPKKKKSKGPKFGEDKISLIDNIITEIGLDVFEHKDVLSAIESKGGLGLKLDSNWKESWAIMKEMVDQGLLIKDGRKYKRSSIE